jgi:hypothetical protein
MSMNDFSAQMPLSLFIYKRRTFSPKLYIKSACAYENHHSFGKAVLTSIGAASLAFMLVAVMAFVNGTL